VQPGLHGDDGLMKFESKERFLGGVRQVKSRVAGSITLAQAEGNVRAGKAVFDKHGAAMGGAAGASFWRVETVSASGSARDSSAVRRSPSGSRIRFSIEGDMGLTGEGSGGSVICEAINRRDQREDQSPGQIASVELRAQV
jgi:hypothetical protein